MADETRNGLHTEDWHTLPWKHFHRNVYRLQKRIYQAAHQNDIKRVHNLQQLLIRSWAARCLAVRRVTQDNRGKNTPGIDGIARLTPRQRLHMVEQLRTLRTHRPASLRRVEIDKPGKTEKRPLSIPCMLDRAAQTLIKMALEPEWEARFEPNSYGFRPGRSCHDAIEAIFNFTARKPKYVLDADITKCFDRISHSALLAKLHTPQPITRLIRAWLKAGILHHGHTIFPHSGVPQGSPIAPLLANIALHGFETAIHNAAPSRPKPALIRYADDFVIIHPDLNTLLHLQQVATDWLAELGLQLHPQKTRISHTLKPYNGNLGFDFLGFHIRQYPVGKHRLHTFHNQPGFKVLITPSPKALQRHRDKLRQTIHHQRGASQAALIKALRPIIQGWCNYYRHCTAKQAFGKLEHTLHHQLLSWAKHRHPRKTPGWRYQRYWRITDNRKRFADDTYTLKTHADTPIQRYTKVQNTRSPYDGDWLYWATRLGQDPTHPRRITWLLKQQRGCCAHCGLPLTRDDVLEVHHHDGNHQNHRYHNLRLVHGHCHDDIHKTRYL